MKNENFENKTVTFSVKTLIGMLIFFAGMIVSLVGIKGDFQAQIDQVDNKFDIQSAKISETIAKLDTLLEKYENTKDNSKENTIVLNNVVDILTNQEERISSVEESCKTQEINYAEIIVYLTEMDKKIEELKK